jgi:hypothetical protein
MPVDHAAKRTWASREIEADAATIFAVLSDPSLHSVIDGSGTVRGSAGPRDQRLELGSKFGINMRMGVPYRMPNTVVEFEQDRLIAWCHPGKHRWRWEVEPLGDGSSCRVTETFDWSTSRLPWLIERVGYPEKHLPNIERSLQRLDAYVTHRAAAV